MIDVERIAEAPWRREVELPVATDEQAEQVIDTAINHVIDYIRKPFRFSVCYSRELFTLKSDEFITIGESGDGEPVFRIEPGRIQDIGTRVMSKYGLDLEVHQEEKKHIEADNIQEVITIYPSKTIKGLVFERRQQHNRETNEVYEVEWCVNHKVAMMKFNPIEALRTNN